MGVVYRLKCSETGQVYYGKFQDTWRDRCRSGWSVCSCKYFVNPTHEFIEIDIPNDKLKEREDYYIQNFECVNIQSKYSHLPKAEWSKQYYVDNIEKRKQYDKQYRIDNKEITKQRNKQYYADNKHRINQKIKCNNCGSTIVKRNLKEHQTSKKCVNLLYSI